MKNITKLTLAIVFVTIQFACVQKTEAIKTTEPNSKPDVAKVENERKAINTLLDSFNDAAAKAEFERYFGYFAENAIFIGTDATENWNKKAFKVWAKPHFDKKKTWDFKSIERHVFFDKTGKVAWFDELLDTQMKICRGSGVLTKQGDEWKIQQYVLSMTIPNDNVDAVVKIKTPIEEGMIKKLTGK
jgi:ketosteroid isomerase-like protein